MKKCLLALLLVSLSAGYMGAEDGMEAKSTESKGMQLRLAAFISDNMVLQAGKPITIWGWASPGEQVLVSIAGQKGSAKAGENGKWSVILKPLQSGGPHEMSIVGKTTLKVSNVLIGEVWLCSGQSNMTVALWEANDAEQEKNKANDSKIRFFRTPLCAPPTPADDVPGKWVICSPETVNSFSAVAYFFGLKLRQTLDVPVGLILSAHGSTSAESWISLKGLQTEPELSPIIDYFNAMPKDQRGWDISLPTGLYNGRIAPFSSMPLRGFIWYQGENNVSRAAAYRKLFPALIRDWRRAWGEDLPFYFVQLANYKNAKQQPDESDWAELREAQTMALQLPNTGMAVAIDIGDAQNIHPKNKQDVGARLARNALSKTYGKNVNASGPLYKSMRIDGNCIHIAFSNVASGLVAKGGKLKHFAIAGEERRFVWADAVIDGDTVVVNSEQVNKPIAVRYAWADNPASANLYNSEGLPASPFRTDTWAGITEKNGVTPTFNFEDLKRQGAKPPTGSITGNTISINTTQTLPRRWIDMKYDGYVYAPRQTYDPNKRMTQIWLPYGNTGGMYYALNNMQVTDAQPDGEPKLETIDPHKPAQLIYKFHFDRPISSFNLVAGTARFTCEDALAGIAYSTDGQTWKTISSITRSGEHQMKGHTANLTTCDLYLKLFTANAKQPDAETLPEASLRIRMAGNVCWGDAAWTWFNAQWQLWITSTENSVK